MATRTRPTPAFTTYSLLRLACYVVAIVLFVLAAFVDTWTRTQMAALGLAFFAAGHVVP